MMLEISKIKGYEKFVNYYIDSKGNIYNGTKQLKGCIDTKGYKYLHGGKHIKKHPKIHRLVALAFIPNIDNKPQINHKDGNKLNNSVDNLEWCTNSDNQIHALQTGLKPRKLNEENIKYLIENWDNFTKKELAKQLNFNVSTLYKIYKGYLPSYKDIVAKYRNFND